MKKNSQLFYHTCKNILYGILIQVVVVGFVLAHDGESSGGDDADSLSLKKVSIQMRVTDATLTEVFQEVEQKSEFKFFYDKKIVNSDTKYTFNKDITLYELMLQLSEQSNLNFKRVNKNINVKKSETFKSVPVQEINISGKVTSDENPEGIPGVNVVIKGTTKGTVTDYEGNFKIAVPSQETILVFSSIGYLPKEVTVGTQTTLNVAMELDVTALEEIVVVGYGQQKKADLTGAVSVVKTEDLQKRQATTVAEAMQGLATGVTVRGGGLPGSEAQIQIRGISNFSGNNPLYVIDGMITTANRDFNPNDIESIQVLKDASAAAIYGSRAANGVIIITTKKGKEGPMKINFSGKTGFQTIPRYDLAGRDEYIRINDMAYDNAGVPRQDHDLNNDTDWQDETFRTGNIHDYNLTFSGGSENGNYLISGNYFKNKGTVISTGFDRYSIRVNTQAKRGIFSIGENVAITNSTSDEMSGNPIMDVVRLMPTIPVYDENNPGGFGYGNEARARTFATNPLAIAEFDDRLNQNFRVRGNVWSELQFLPSLKYRANFGYETSNDHYLYLRKEGNWTLNQPYTPSLAIENRARSAVMLVENTVSFNKTFGNHNLEALVGQTYQEDQYSRIEGRKRNLPKNPTTGEYYTVLDQGDQAVVTGFEQKAVLLSYLGRINYNYAGKYFFNAVVRRDGTSRLSPDNRWSNFPSVAVGWRVSEEPFFNVEAISNLKLRANYGTLGSSNIGFWDYQQNINTFPTIVIGKDQHVEAGATNVRLSNNNLKWERLQQQNFGLDLGLFEDKLTATAEYYISKTDGVLTEAPIAMTTGNDGGNPVVNAASISNSGFEFSLSLRGAEKKLKYNASLNLTTIKNKVLDLGYGRNDIYVGNTVTTVGNPIGMWYMLETDGIFQSEAEVSAHKSKDETIIQPDAKPGDIRYVDHNGDGRITNDDKVVLGNPWADVELGLNLNMSYSNFEFTMNWFSSLGATVYNGPMSVMGRFDDNSNYPTGIQPWTPESPNTDVPRAYYGTTLNSRADTDRWLEDGSFARLKFISLTYHMPASFANKIGVENASVSLSAQNLITLTKYKGLDPEFLGPSIYERGLDLGAFPNLKTVSVGLNFGF
ncbi:TonB-dependent receptor [Limibacter armeniacum]|uniref:SusC/RagA family TonB-linked outer membrane protein n=1 Tax=Limibacter armeniacum TaxID=466084 RepID=UPI002FE58BE1